MINYENEVAVKCGINAAVIADYLWNLKENHRFGKGKSAYRYGKVWVRCSQPMITSEIRYLTIDSIISNPINTPRKGTSDNVRSLF